MRLSPPSRMATPSVTISGPWEYPLPNALTFSPERPAAATALLTLKVLKTAAWVERNFCAEPALFKRCSGRGRDNALQDRRPDLVRLHQATGSA